MNPPTSNEPTHTASLHCREGNSDKVYRAAVEPRGGGFVVTFAYGRRGSTLTTGIKSENPQPLDAAVRQFQKLVTSKLAKGYRPAGESAQPCQQSGSEGKDSGLRCQLLNPVEVEDAPRLLAERRFCLQEKHDGRRLMVRRQGGEITGINRRGLIVALPDPIRGAAAQLPCDVLIDGEAVGDTLFAFDLLEMNGGDLRPHAYRDRFASLTMVLAQDHPALRVVAMAESPVGKSALFEELRRTSREGVVFKQLNAPFTPGRPNSGGPQLKCKFVESASFVVLGRNARRSVALGLHDGDTLVPAGSVTIPPNHDIPAVNDVVEVRYLYAYRESGAICQPVYLGKRTDIPAAECGVEQIKYKTATAAA